ncbi:MAG: TatD family deoxyribonuclease [Bacteroidetes bacterium]|nr:MAG: TatD family deoxyribonuclease [Bacteroidota bacterium]
MKFFVDTHCHIDLDAFEKDRDEVISRSVAAGVFKLVIPNIDAPGIRHQVSVAESYPDVCFPMMGLHPTSVKEDYREQMGVIEMELRKNRDAYCAVGEIGIDLYWDKTFAREQEDVFVRQLELAQELNRPVVIHTRNSMDVALEICEGLREEGRGKREEYKGQKAKGKGRRGVFHCFSGSLRQADRAIELGFKLGIGGVVTFRNSGLQQVVQAVELEHLLVETDAPFLAPVPFRGQRNEPAYIPYIAEKVAELKNVTVEEVAEVTTAGALEMFGIRVEGRGTRADPTSPPSRP